MDPSCLQYRLSPDERRSFNETGCLIIENALSTHSSSPPYGRNRYHLRR